MSGIAGIVTLERPVDAGLVAGVLRMLDAQVHRGPNDWGLLLPDQALRDRGVQALLASFDPAHIRAYQGSAAAPAAVLGARRLSIIDLTPRGRIPMGNVDGRIWITYNGEIYNFRELRAELQIRGYHFLSDTDTETILHGYEEWGEQVVQHLRGMFAFAIFDARASDDVKLLLAKDRFGIKPLYWARKNRALQFASEVRALMAGGLMPNEPEPRGFHGFLVYGSVPTPFTTVRDVFSLPAAHTLMIDERTYSYPRPYRYWSLPKAGSLTRASEEAAQEVRHLLEESIRMHLVSDVPLGVFLSGGIDSSAITAIASKDLCHPLTTVCVSFDEKPFSEGEQAEQIATRFGCKHIDVRLHAHDFVEEIPRVLAAMDQPSVDGVNTYFVAKAARATGLTVALSGLGGHEIFWGYPGFRAAPRLASLARFPGVQLAAGLASAVGRFFGYERLEKLDFLREESALGAYLAVRGLFPPCRAARLLDAGMLPLTLPDVERESLHPSDYAELETSLYLQNQLLRDCDVFGMAHSLEIRVPFLDHRLAEFVFALPERLKGSSRVNKPLLVSALSSDLDLETVTRRKMGFTFPFERWMREYRRDISEYTDSTVPVDRRSAETIWDAFSKGRIHWSRPWAVSVLQGMSKRGAVPVWPMRSGPGRILFLLPEAYSSKGGIPTYNQKLFRAVAEAFPRCDMRVISMNDTMIPASTSAYGRFHFIGCGPRGSAFQKIRVVLRAVREALQERPDLIICGHLHLGPLAVVCSLLSQARFALLAYGIEAWTPTPFLRWAARRAHRVFPISRYTADRMIEWGIDGDCMRILPVTVDGEEFRRMGRRTPTNRRSLLTVARLDTTERYKGVETVLMALLGVRAHFPDVRYIVAGQGDDLERLRTVAQKAGVGNLVEFTGYVSDEALPLLFNRTDLFVMPSRKEGFGIVFLEALACGLPVIAGNRDGSVDALLDGRLGLLVDPEGCSQLERSITCVLNGTVDEKLRDPVRLRAEVLAHYGFDRFRERVRTSLLNLWETARP